VGVFLFLLYFIIDALALYMYHDMELGWGILDQYVLAAGLDTGYTYLEGLNL